MLRIKEAQMKPDITTIVEVKPKKTRFILQLKFKYKGMNC